MTLSEEEKLKVLEASFTQSFSSIVITDADLENGGPHILLCNDSFCNMTGYAKEELIGQNPKILQGPLTDRDVIKRLKQCLQSGDFFHGRATNYRKDGSPYVVEWNISAIKDENGKICYYVSVQNNLSSLVVAEREREVLAKALQETSDCVMVTDKSGHILFVNHGFERVTGYDASEIVGKKPFFICSDHAPAGMLPNTGTASTEENEILIRKKDGTLGYLMRDVSTIHSNDGLLCSDVCIGKDVTEQVMNREKLKRLAQTDPLTGLLNRHAGDAVIELALSDANSSSNSFSIVIGDIDHFKTVNDKYGHLAGDKVLIAVATLLKHAIRDSDYCIRWGGEEFLIVLPGCAVDVASRLADHIRSDMTAQDYGEVGQVTMSFGVAQWNPSESVESLINRADEALYEAKRGGRNRVCISSAA